MDRKGSLCSKGEIISIEENSLTQERSAMSGFPACTPALTNDIYDLTGKRIRKLLFNLGEV